MTFEGELKEIMAIRKKCKSTCNSIYGFTAMLFIFLIFTLMNSMPCLSATLRSFSFKYELTIHNIILIDPNSVKLSFKYW